MTLIGLHKRGKDGSTDPSSNEIDHIPLHVYKRRFKRKKLANPNECKEVIEKCIGNIRNQIERQFEPIVPQAAYQPTASPKEEEEEDFNWTPLADTPAEQKEHEDLWKEMEHSLTTLALLEQKQV